MDRPPYLATPDTAERTLSLDEVESLEQSRGKPLKDQRTASHFTHRVLLTMREYINAVQRLTHELERVQAKSRNRAGVATTLSPMDAAQYLTSEQRAELFDATMRSAVERTNQARREAEHELTEARKLRGRLQLAMTKVLDDPRIDPTVRTLLEQELDRLQAIDTGTPACSTIDPSDTLGAIFD